jgi:dipeptide/tripeptide permease
MELLAVLGIIHCTVAMGFVFFSMQYQGNIAFALSIIFIILSLIASIGELLLSTKALNIEIEDME